MTKAVAVANLADHFTTAKSRAEFAGEELLAYDVDQLLHFEMDYARCDLGRTADGLPPTSVLVACWSRMRDSWERVMLALPPGPDRDEMVAFLAERDAAMERLREKARNLVRLKTVQGNG